MSAQQTFALCLDCWEFSYGIADKNGVFERDSSSSNHWNHAVHVFGSPASYEGSTAQPIRQVLMDLQRGIPISDGRMEMFSLCCAVNALQPNNGIAVKGADVPLGAVQLYQSKQGNEPDAVEADEAIDFDPAESMDTLPGLEDAA